MHPHLTASALAVLNLPAGGQRHPDQEENRVALPVFFPLASLFHTVPVFTALSPSPPGVRWQECPVLH